MHTEAEAREIVSFVEDADGKVRLDNYMREPRYQFAKGFLAGIAHERGRAERLVELLQRNLERMKLINREDQECVYIRPSECPNHELIHETEEALSAYNQERGEKEGI